MRMTYSEYFAQRKAKKPENKKRPHKYTPAEQRKINLLMEKIQQRSKAAGLPRNIETSEKNFTHIEAR